MLTVAEETLQQLAREHGKEVATHLYGQEINAETYAICKADLLLKGEGEAADNIVGGPEHSTLSNDAFPSREFDFMLSNPPYGKSWKTDLERMGGKRGMRDPRFVIEHAGDPEYSQELVRLYLGGAERDRLDPILDACVTVYLRELDEDGQVEFKGNAKAFIRTYGFLSAVLPYSNAGWEKRSIFLNLLVPKLPAPEEPDLAKGILDAIDLDSYRVEKQAMQKILLPDEDADRVRQLIIETIPTRVVADTAFTVFSLAYEPASPA